MSLTSRLNALLDYANQTTEAGDTTLGDAVKTLVDGYGQGGGGLPDNMEVLYDDIVHITYSATSSAIAKTIPIGEIADMPLRKYPTIIVTITDTNTTPAGNKFLHSCSVLGITGYGSTSASLGARSILIRYGSAQTVAALTYGLYASDIGTDSGNEIVKINGYCRNGYVTNMNSDYRIRVIGVNYL